MAGNRQSVMTKKPASDGAARKAVEGREPKSSAARSSDQPPAAGPHADPALTNPSATPGAGTLPRADEREDSDSTSG